MQAAVLDRYITIDPAICHGRPHIAGHRIRVQDIAVWHERLGYSIASLQGKAPSPLQARLAELRGQ